MMVYTWRLTCTGWSYVQFKKLLHFLNARAHPDPSLCNLFNHVVASAPPMLLESLNTGMTKTMLKDEPSIHPSIHRWGSSSMKHGSFCCLAWHE